MTYCLYHFPLELLFLLPMIKYEHFQPRKASLYLKESFAWKLIFVADAFCIFPPNQFSLSLTVQPWPPPQLGKFAFLRIAAHKDEPNFQ